MEILHASSVHHKIIDEYVEKHIHASPYHKRAWLEAVSAAYKMKTTYLVAIQENELVGVLPLAEIKTPIIGKKLCTLPYCDLGGALVNSLEVEAELMQCAMNYGLESNANKLEYRAQQTKLEDISQAPKVRMLLDLPESSQVLLASFKSKLRSQINKAKKNGLTASIGNDQKHLDGFYQVYTRNMRDLGSPAHSKKWFAEIVKNYGENVVIANVYKNSTVVGAGIVLFNGASASIPWASTNSDYNKLAPNMLLYWTLLAHVTDKGMAQFDFGRSTPGEGTYKFKAQWGAKPVALDWQEYIHGERQATKLESGKSKSREHIENLWRRLPVGVATYVGASLRRYISL